MTRGGEEDARCRIRIGPTMFDRDLLGAGIRYFQQRRDISNESMSNVSAPHFDMNASRDDFERLNTLEEEMHAALACERCKRYFYQLCSLWKAKVAHRKHRALLFTADLPLLPPPSPPPLLPAFDTTIAGGGGSVDLSFKLDLND